MTRRERLEAKLEKRRQWAQKAEQRSESAYARSNAAVAGIPMGQPILVGHHSERRHRRAIERAQNAMSKSCDESNLAKHHVSKAGGLAHQLDTHIFSDDEDATEQIESKIAALERRQEEMKAVNTAIRKHAKEGHAAQLAALVAIVNSEAMAAELLKPDCFNGIGFARYQLTNNNANIRRLRERLKIIAERRQRAAAAEESGGVALEDHGEYCRVTFADKPDRSVLNALREAGFHWGGGSWSGRKDKLPGCVAEMLPDKSCHTSKAPSVETEAAPTLQPDLL